jgi:AmiR/NasT family two-component response regulator
MSLETRVYSVLIVSTAKRINSALLDLLSEERFSPVRITSDIASAERALADREYDFVIVNSPLPDDVGIRFSIDTGSSKSCVVLMLIRADQHLEVFDTVAPHGVFTLPKPTSKGILETALKWMISAREHLRKNEAKTMSIEEKMAEIRIVNKAKWLLIRELNMDEPEAHRYIEKSAMDRCVSKREIAESIIKTYSAP